jgi:hypothetical protein
MKIQVIVDHGGRPIFISGPHIGVRSDISIWRRDGPWLGHAEYVLGDKAYIGDGDIISPYKKPALGSLSQVKKDVNTIHSWFRATVEHTFAPMKSFHILGLIFRGKVSGEHHVDFVCC